MSSSEKQKEKIKVLRENNSSMTKILGNKENDGTNFLSSSKSFIQYNKERMETFFVPKSIAETNVQKRFEDEKAQRRKPKVSIGKFSNYQFDKTKFLQDMKSIPSGTPVSWTELARKYQVRNAQGNAPGNAGQVLFQFARPNGIDVFQCRVRRPKHKLVKRLSIPMTRPVSKLKEDIQHQVETGKLNIGVNIAPKIVKTNIINDDGKMVDKTFCIWKENTPETNT